MNGSICLIRFKSSLVQLILRSRIISSKLQFLTSPAIEGRRSGKLYLTLISSRFSHLLIREIPDWPAKIFLQVVLMSLPRGVTNPKPVTTTLCLSPFPIIAESRIIARGGGKNRSISRGNINLCSAASQVDLIMNDSMTLQRFFINLNAKPGSCERLGNPAQSEFHRLVYNVFLEYIVGVGPL